MADTGRCNRRSASACPRWLPAKRRRRRFTSARVGWIGVGINLATRRPTPEQIRGAVRTVLAGSHYREHGKRLQKNFSRYEALGEIARSVDGLIAGTNGGGVADASQRCLRVGIRASSNSRSLRDDNQEKQRQIQGFFAALRMTPVFLRGTTQLRRQKKQEQRISPLRCSR